MLSKVMPADLVLTLRLRVGCVNKNAAHGFSVEKEGTGHLFGCNRLNLQNPESGSSPPMCRSA
jgi:hypothetical protein